MRFWIKEPIVAIGSKIKRLNFYHFEYKNCFPTNNIWSITYIITNYIDNKMTLTINIPNSVIYGIGVYAACGLLTYRIAAPVFDALSGYMPPCAMKYFIYGVMWPIPASILIITPLCAIISSD